MNRSRKQGAAVTPLLWALALAGILLAVALSASSAEASHKGEQPVQDGGLIIFEQCSIVSATILQSDAAFTNVFWRFGPDLNLGFSNQDVGTTFSIGQIPANQELVLGIKVNETGNVFQTGAGARNPDGLVHAIVSSTPSVTGTTIGFEDKALGERTDDFDYNDAILKLTVAPCPTVPPPPERVTLIVQVDPASTGTGGIAGGGTYDLGSTTTALASPSAGSTFGGWSGDCGGFSQSLTVLMDRNKTCVALFLAAPVVTPTPPPTPTVTPPVPTPPVPTPTPPVEVLPSTVGIDNTLVSLNPARVGEEVTFRVDVELNVPAENTADVRYTFDDTELRYLRASWNGVTLTQCSLSGAGVIDCAFGTASVDFAYDLHFEALKPATESTTAATLSADPDAGGVGAAITVGPALADVDIVGIQGPVPVTGDGSVVAAGSSVPSLLIAFLGAIVLATVAGAMRLRTNARS